MARVKFTAGRVAGFNCPPDKAMAFLWDDEVKQLALRCKRGGKPAYVFQSRHPALGTIRITIGDPATWTIEAARAKARELQRLIDQGHDPREVKRQHIEQARVQAQQAAVRKVEAIEVWHRYCEERRRAWGERHHADHVKLVQPGGEPKKRGKGETQPGPLRELLIRPLAQLDAAAVEAWAARHAAERPTVARLCLRLLGVFLNWCRAHPDYRHALPDGNAAKSRGARDALGKPKAKNDALLREQLRPWFDVARQQDPVVSAYLQALLLTGARPGELLRLGWPDVDFQWKSLTIRDKVEGERVIPLTPYVAALLAGLPRRGPYVFMSGKAAGPIAPPNHAATRVCTLAGVPPITLHGLRRSFKSLSEWVEVPVGVVAQIMGHKPSATAEKHYTVRPLDLLAKWHVKIEGWILEQAGIEAPSADDAAQRLRVVA